MNSLFGTDGIRGVANTYPIIPELAVNVGRAISRLLKHNHRATVLIGKDTRISGDMIESALSAGICSAGGDARTCGVLPTPAVAYLTRTKGFDAGIMVSASHNPYYDNGIKIFDKDGFKLSTETEKQIEEAVLKGWDMQAIVPKDPIGKVSPEIGAEEQYIDFIINSGSNAIDLKGLKMVLDCSNGAAYKVAPAVFSRLGASLVTLFAEPDGININDGCGSEHLSSLKQKVLDAGADIGLAFDGDADRLIAIDEKGQAVAGDKILAICAKQMKIDGNLKNNRVVSTVMSNVGLKNVLATLDINHSITDVGDRCVLDEMRKSGAVVGGEDSGHMIFLDRHTSGDGLLTGLRLIEVMNKTGKKLSELAGIMTVYPQVLKNIKIQEKTDIFAIPEIADIISGVEKQLDGQGRVLVRYSGTQPLCRVMVEGPDRKTTENCCDRIVEVIDRMIGAK